VGVFGGSINLFNFLADQVNRYRRGDASTASQGRGGECPNVVKERSIQRKNGRRRLWTRERRE